MKKVDFLIVGGSAAGTTAAEVIRSLKPDSSITIIHDEEHEQYSRVLLPHYIRGKVKREQVFLKKPEWYEEKNIELAKARKAVSLDAKSHRVKDSGGEEYQYDKLLLAIGGHVIPIKVPGADLANILYMRTIEDAEKIVKVSSQSQRAVIVGGGFIGLEFTSSLKMNGVSEVTVLVREPYYWQGKLDRESSMVLVGTLEKSGVKVLVNEEVDHFSGSSSVESVTTKSGKTFEAQAVGIGVGIKSDLSWLNGSGLKTNRAIVTNEYLETNLPDVYAAGDCAEFKDVIFARQHIMGNWANATSQGNAVGRTMVATPLRQGSEGQGKTVFETASSYSINFFDGSCSFIGVTDQDFADEVISRGSVDSGKMTRIFVKTIDNVTRIVGATVINDPAEVGPLTMAVKNKIDVSLKKDKLSDSSFNLGELASNP